MQRCQCGNTQAFDEFHNLKLTNLFGFLRGRIGAQQVFLLDIEKSQSQ